MASALQHGVHGTQSYAQALNLPAAVRSRQPLRCQAGMSTCSCSTSYLSSSTRTALSSRCVKVLSRACHTVCHLACLSQGTFRLTSTFPDACIAMSGLATCGLCSQRSFHTCAGTPASCAEVLHMGHLTPLAADGPMLRDGPVTLCEQTWIITTCLESIRTLIRNPSNRRTGVHFSESCVLITCFHNQVISPGHR